VRKAAGGALRSSPLDRLKDKEKLIPDWDFSALDSLLAQVPSSAQQRHMKAAAMKVGIGQYPPPSHGPKYLITEYSPFLSRAACGGGAGADGVSVAAG